MRVLFILSFFISVMMTASRGAQSIQAAEEAHYFFNDSNILITYREGGLIYGTLYFIEIHISPNGYGMYGRNTKHTVMENYQTNNWEEFGTWQVTEQNRLSGIYYTPLNKTPLFIPIYKLVDASLMINESTTMIRQGQALCN